MFKNTKFKLSEAQYFLIKMEEFRNLRDEFRYNLSAFVTASESVIAHLLIETNALNVSLNAWRDDRIKELNRDELKIIINSSRRQTIHQKALNPRTEEDVIPQALPSPRIDFNMSPIFVSADGKITYGMIPPDIIGPIIYTYVKESKHYFQEHKSDIVTICREHIKNLDTLILEFNKKYKK